jgi:hypothetical protein
MPRQKTSKAVIKAARFNPETSEYDRRALEIIEQLEADGYNFKQIVVDAILRASGATPEMFERPGVGTADLQRLLEQFAQEILNEVRKGGDVPKASRHADGDDPADVSPFTRNFARSFVQRQQRATGEDE